MSKPFPAPGDSHADERGGGALMNVMASTPPGADPAQETTGHWLQRVHGVMSSIEVVRKSHRTAEEES